MALQGGRAKLWASWLVLLLVVPLAAGAPSPGITVQPLSPFSGVLFAIQNVLAGFFPQQAPPPVPVPPEPVVEWVKYPKRIDDFSGQAKYDFEFRLKNAAADDLVFNLEYAHKRLGFGEHVLASYHFGGARSGRVTLSGAELKALLEPDVLGPFALDSSNTLEGRVRFTPPHGVMQFKDYSFYGSEIPVGKIDKWPIEKAPAVVEPMKMAIDVDEGLPVPRFGDPLYYTNMVYHIQMPRPPSPPAEAMFLGLLPADQQPGTQRAAFQWASPFMDAKRGEGKAYNFSVTVKQFERKGSFVEAMLVLWGNGKEPVATPTLRLEVNKPYRFYLVWGREGGKVLDSPFTLLFFDDDPTNAGQEPGPAPPGAQEGPKAAPPQEPVQPPKPGPGAEPSALDVQWTPKTSVIDFKTMGKESGAFAFEVKAGAAAGDLVHVRILDAQGEVLLDQDLQGMRAGELRLPREAVQGLFDGAHELAIFNATTQRYLSGRASFEVRNSPKKKPDDVEWRAAPTWVDAAKPESVAQPFTVRFNVSPADFELGFYRRERGQPGELIQPLSLRGQVQPGAEATFVLNKAVLLSLFGNGEFQLVVKNKRTQKTYDNGPVFSVQGVQDLYWLKPSPTEKIPAELPEDVFLGEPKATIDLSEAGEADLFLRWIVSANVKPFQGKMVIRRMGEEKPWSESPLSAWNPGPVTLPFTKANLEALYFQGERKVQVFIERVDGSRIGEPLLLVFTKSVPPALKEAETGLREILVGVTPRKPVAVFERTYIIPPGKDKKLAFGVRNQKANELTLTSADPLLVQFRGLDARSPGNRRGEVLSMQATIEDPDAGKVRLKVTTDYSKFLDSFSSFKALPEDVFRVTLPFHWTSGASNKTFDVRVIRNQPGVVLFSSALSWEAKAAAQEIARREGWYSSEAVAQNFSTPYGLQIVRRTLMGLNDGNPSEQPLRYLFIVGDESSIPILDSTGVIPLDPLKAQAKSRDGGKPLFAPGKLVLDHFFANLDDSADEELAVGRLPFDDAEKIWNYMAYYYALPWDPDYRKPGSENYLSYAFVVWPDETYRSTDLQAITRGQIEAAFQFSGLEPMLLENQQFAGQARRTNQTAPVNVYYDPAWVRPLLENTQFALLNSHGNTCGFATPVPGQKMDEKACKTFLQDELSEFPSNSQFFCEACLTAHDFGKVALQKGLANFFGCYESCVPVVPALFNAGAGYPFGRFASDYLGAQEFTVFNAVGQYARPPLPNEPFDSHRFSADDAERYRKQWIESQWILYGNPRTGMPSPPVTPAEQPRYSLQGDRLTVWLPRPSLENAFARKSFKLTREEAANLRAGYYAVGAMARSVYKQFFLPMTLSSKEPPTLDELCVYPRLDFSSLYVKTSPSRVTELLSKAPASQPALVRSAQTLADEVHKNFFVFFRSQKPGQPPAKNTWANGQPIEEKPVVLPLSRACPADVSMDFVALDHRLFLYNGESTIPLQNLGQSLPDLSVFKGVREARLLVKSADGKTEFKPLLDVFGRNARWRGFLPLEGNDLRFGFGWAGETELSGILQEERSPLVIDLSSTLRPNSFMPEELFALESKTPPGPLQLEFTLERK